VTELTVRGISGLSVDGKLLAGLLDLAREEICYEENDPPGRQNFSIAHELGHYFLHYLPAQAAAAHPTLFQKEHFEQFDSELFRVSESEKEGEPTPFFRCSENQVDAPEEVRTGRLSRTVLSDTAEQVKLARIIRQKELANRLEWEANIFARGLLMPSGLVRQLNTKYVGDVKAVADELGVSELAMRYRLNNLGLRHDENMGLPLKNKSKSKKKFPNQGSFF
jgi:Zn-dependent peptidase ImmA (M78 family)